jgi:ABC-2 type transport system permease protein
MKAKLKFLIKQSLKKKLKSKWFKISNIIILILLIGILNIDRIISFFGGDYDETIKIYVLDDASSYDLFKNDFTTFESSLEDIANYKIIKASGSIEDLEEKINETNNIILHIYTDEVSYIKASAISYDAIGTITEQLIESSLNSVKNAYVLESSGMSSEEIASLTSSVELQKEVTNPSLTSNAESSDVLTSSLIIIFIIPFFLLITTLTQMIGAEINDEKSTRGMEIIISNVSPKTHFLSKIVASTLFVLIQFLLLAFYALIAVLIRKLLGFSVTSDTVGIVNDFVETIKNTGVLSLLLKGLPVIIILFISSFVLYAIVAGVLASMTTNIEDYQQLQMPLTIILMVGYYLAIASSTFTGSIFIKLVAYIPMMSFLIAPIIYLLGQFSLLELLISTIICVITTCLLFYFGLRIYKVGILNYSSKNLWSKIFKSVKEK